LLVVPEPPPKAKAAVEVPSPAKLFLAEFKSASSVHVVPL
jgi:hypothetical protein